MAKKIIPISNYRIKEFKPVLFYLFSFTSSSILVLLIAIHTYIEKETLDIKFLLLILLTFWSIISIIYISRLLISKESLFIEFSNKFIRFRFSTKVKEKTIQTTDIETIEIFEQDIWVHTKSESIIKFNLSNYPLSKALEIIHHFKILSDKINAQ